VTALINEDVGIAILDPALLHDDLLHGRVVLMLVHALLEEGVSPAKALLGDQFGFEPGDVLVVELEPVALGGVALFDE
jgi:hypothetical protein